jgi:hypothetical protein
MSAQRCGKQLVVVGMLVLLAGLGEAGQVVSHQGQTPPPVSLEFDLQQQALAHAQGIGIDWTEFACPRPPASGDQADWLRLLQSAWERLVRLAAAGGLRGFTQEDSLPTCVF